MVTGTCALCGENKNLHMSHIIPNFVFKWMKETSATGFLRSAENPEKRLQDFAKLPFLCLECEQLFSKFESYFAKQLFFPVLNKKIVQVSYDEKLLGFIISLSWRTLKKTYAANCTQHPWIKEHLDMAEKIWRDYLLGARKDVLPYESYMLFMDSLPETLEFPPKFHWYAFRSVDSTLASNIGDTVFSYTHFPQFFFVSSIFPCALYPDWRGTKIEKTGAIKMKFEFNKVYFNNFLVSRYKFALPAFDSANPHIQAQIGSAIDSNPKKFFDSKSLQFYLMESRRKRLRTVGKCLESIKTLIEVIDYAAETPELTPEQRTMAKYTGDIVANSLLRLPSNKAIVIDALLKSTVALANNQHLISKCNFETNDIRATFIVALCSRDEYNKMLDSALESLRKKRVKGDERILVAFFINPSDEDMPFGVVYDPYLGSG